MEGLNQHPARASGGHLRHECREPRERRLERRPVFEVHGPAHLRAVEADVAEAYEPSFPAKQEDLEGS